MFVIVTRYTTSWSWYRILTIATLVVIIVSPFAIQVEVRGYPIRGAPSIPNEPTVNPDAENQLALTTQVVELDQNQLDKELLIGFYNDENQSRAFDPDLTVCVNSSEAQVPYFKLIHDKGQVVESNGTGNKHTIVHGDKRAVGKGPFLCKLSVQDHSHDFIIQITGT
jgi:hypothetical protein